MTRHSLDMDPNDTTPYKHQPWPKSLRDNSRAWQKWEKSRDFHKVMADQYQTRMQGDMVLFGDEGAIEATPHKLCDYWTIRLKQERAPMDILKVQISKDARIEKEILHDLLEMRELTAPSLRSKRSDEDNLRLALTYRLRPWRRFVVDDMRCEVMAKNTTKDSLDIRIQVCCVDKDSVSHTEDLCVIRKATAQEMKDGAAPNVTDKGFIPYKFADVVKDLGACDLVAFGAKYYFEGDLRRMIDELLDSACLMLWPGLRLVLTPEAADLVRQLSAMLAGLDAGTVNLNMLSLENTPANKQALARELTEQFISQLEKLTERCGYPAPNIKSIEKDFTTLQEKITLVEETLGVELDYLDAALDVERALGAVTA